MNIRNKTKLANNNGNCKKNTTAYITTVNSDSGTTYELYIDNKYIDTFDSHEKALDIARRSLK